MGRVAEWGGRRGAWAGGGQTLAGATVVARERETRDGDVGGQSRKKRRGACSLVAGAPCPRFQSERRTRLGTETHDRKDGVALSTVAYGLVDDVVLVRRLLPRGVRELGHSLLQAAEIYQREAWRRRIWVRQGGRGGRGQIRRKREKVRSGREGAERGGRRQTFVEEDFRGEEREGEAELGVVSVGRRCDGARIRTKTFEGGWKRDATGGGQRQTGRGRIGRQKGRGAGEGRSGTHMDWLPRR